MNFKSIALIAFFATIFTACEKDNDNALSTIVINDNFETAANGWTGDFADYPLTPDSLTYNLSFNTANLPLPLNVTKKGLKISGNNHSDDLFMFIKKKISGLKANQNYKFNFQIELASNAPSNASGIGGAPGESVYLGAGVTSIEPKKVKLEGFYRMNINKISQSQSGKDMKIIGNVANGTQKSDYTLLQRSGEFSGTANEKGEAWIIIGTDSGFEGTSTLFYTNVKTTIKKM
ncbi:hypothetical protein ABIB62_003971 [Mucilaginibacter sp. UYP25]|uniref:hypothetical protein n=1 Tax=unclassified Mucilaginibacter TaxID=2617802 RepID=UPI00339727B1